MTEIVTKAEVTFLIPGHGKHTEIYSLDDENDRFCWAVNERLTRATIAHQKPLETISVSDDEAKSIYQSRREIDARVKKRISETRNV